MFESPRFAFATCSVLKILGANRYLQLNALFSKTNPGFLRMHTPALELYIGIHGIISVIVTLIYSQNSVDVPIFTIPIMMGEVFIANSRSSQCSCIRLPSRSW